MDTLQIVLVAGLVVMAVVNAVSLIWASYLDHRLRQKPVPKVYEVHVDGTKLFTQEDWAQVNRITREELQKAAAEAAGQLQKSLDNAVTELSAHMTELANDSISPEFEKYQVSLEALREQSIGTFTKLQQELDKRRDQLIAELEKDMTVEKEKRIALFNQRLNDVVSSYLAESLGTNVDLGAQTNYILQSLQTHREDIKRDILT